jgi:cyclopropane fatty-acyl-phospholipid synthase-like methyltransferase
MDLKATYNRIAQDWDADHEKDDWWIEGLNAFVSLLRPGATVLDVGCGSGIESEILVEKGLQVTGMDFAENLLAIAKRRLSKGKFLLVDLYDLSSLNKKFDAIFAQAVLLHIPKKDVREIIHSLNEKLIPGGYFYVAVKEQREGEKEEELVKENDYGYEYERFFSYFSMEEVRQFFLDEGMKIVYESAAHSGRRNWIQIIGKSKD